MQQLKNLANFSSLFSLDTAPPEVLHAARYCVLDSMGSALGAAHHEEVPGLVEELTRWGDTATAPTASIWGYRRKTGTATAILLNGIMGHALELDDVHTASKSHPGAVIVPAAWTLAEAMGSTGGAFLQAVIAGYEVMGRVGMAMDVASTRRRGWHNTGVIGTFGAAAACARLLELNEAQTLSALGMAGTQSSGLWAFLAEGATCKKLHPARAAVNGFSAAVLARGGMTGPAHILDAEDGGLYPAVSDSFDPDLVDQGLGQSWEVTRIDKKPYPCCRTTHHAIDAALRLREEGVAAADIVAVQVETYDVGVLQCGFPGYPGSGVEAKFSIAYTAAAAFVYGTVSLAQFGEEARNNPLVRKIAQSTTVVGDPLFTERYPARWGCRMTVTLSDGGTRACQIDDMSGSVSVPLTGRQEQDKFLGLTEGVLGRAEAQGLMELILHVDSIETLPQL